MYRSTYTIPYYLFPFIVNLLNTSENVLPPLFRNHRIISGKKIYTIPKHEPIKKVYVEMVRQIVESEARNDEEA